MKKIWALIISALIVLLLFIILTNIKLSNENQKETVFISRVIDGDTIVLNDSRHIRLLNINSPEKSSELSKSAKLFLSQYENKSIEIQITEKDLYNRYLARIYAPDYVNLELVSLGFASKFLVNEKELNIFSNAEKNAISQGLGIWNKSEYSGCVKTKIDPEKEEVKINIICLDTNTDGWYLKDESRKQYKFYTLKNSKIVLHSGKGKDNLTDIFWNLNTDVWNNDRDSLYIFDMNNNLVHSESYGY